MKRRDRHTANDRTTDERGHATGITTERPPLTEIQPPTNDEAGDPSAQNAENPILGRDDVANTSDSSGLPEDNASKGEVIKDQLKRGLREVQPMD